MRLLKPGDGVPRVSPMGRSGVDSLCSDSLRIKLACFAFMGPDLFFHCSRLLSHLFGRMRQKITALCQVQRNNSDLKTDSQKFLLPVRSLHIPLDKHLVLVNLATSKHRIPSSRLRSIITLHLMIAVRF